MGMLRPLKPGGSISVVMRKPLKRQEGESGYTQVCNKGDRESEHQRLL